MSFFKKIVAGTEENKPISKIEWKPLTDLKQLEAILQESNEKTVAIFKHSTRCGISRMVLKQFENEFQLHEEIELYLLDLLNHRDISNLIANRFEVQHQSPQLIVIKEGKSVYNASHESIVADELNDFIL